MIKDPTEEIISSDIKETVEKFKNRETIAASPGEDLDTFLARLAKLRDDGQVVYGVFQGIEFSNEGDDLHRKYMRAKYIHDQKQKVAEELKKKYNVNVPVVLANVGEGLWRFLGRLERLRDNGQEVIGVFCDINFSNMADNLYEAYRKAVIEHEKERERTRLERMKQEAQARIEEISALINGLPENASNYALKDIVDILLKINDIALTFDYSINLTPDLCTKLSQFLTSAGFAPVSDDIKFINAGIINMHTYAPPAPQGKKTIELPFESGCAIYIPNNIDLNDFEQLKYYVIGNFMSQLKDGKLDIANLSLFYRLSDRIKKNQSEPGTMKL